MAVNGVALLAALGSVWGEQLKGGPAANSEDQSAASASDLRPSLAKINVNSDLVVVPVTVTNGKGVIVNGLLKEHFTIFDEKVEQQITHFESEDAPVTIGLVLDTSDSMAPKLRAAREAVTALLNQSNPNDEFFLVQFSDQAHLLVSATTETREIRTHVATMEPAGTTALLDAITVALNESRNARNKRKAIIIVSDGEDNASHCTVRELKEAVREADVVVYAIGIANGVAYSQTGSALLSEITKGTGGRLFEVTRLKQLPDIASKIGAWLRNQYVLAYTPSNVEKNGRYHHIQVRITKPDGFPRLHASWRLGYYAPAEQRE